MEVDRLYQCDYGHHWVVQKQKGDAELPEDIICPEGHEAVTCREDEPADEVQLLIRPAAKIVDRVTGQRAHERKYRVLLLDRTGAEICRSNNMYSWEDAITVGSLFREKSVEQAVKWWARRNP